MDYNFYFPTTKQQASTPQSIVEIIKDYTRSSAFKKQSYPPTINHLPSTHFITQLLQSPHAKHRTSILMPFISPDALMNLYNKKFGMYSYTMVEVHYHFQTTQDYGKFDNINPKDFFYLMKEKQRTGDNLQKAGKIEKRLEEVMKSYLNQSNLSNFNLSEYHYDYFIPKNYFPIISIKINASKENPRNKDSNFKYLLVRLETDKFNCQPTEIHQNIKLKQEKGKKKQKKQKDVNDPKPINKSEELKTRYHIKNYLVGWFQNYEEKSLMSLENENQQFFTYFDVRTIENNVRKKQPKIKHPAFSYLFFRKGPNQSARIQIMTVFFNKIVIKLVIKLNDIRKVDYLDKNKRRELYLHLNRFPQYFIHILDFTEGQSLFTIRSWDRIENFSLDYQISLAQSIFLRNMLSTNSVICVDFATGYKEFGKVIRYFSAQQLIDCQPLNEKPSHKMVIKNSSFPIFQLQRRFDQSLQKVPNQFRITVMHIKFSLFSLKSITGAWIYFEDIISLLQQLQKQKDQQKLQRHNTALKMLCLRPHELLSKPFQTVYQKVQKRFELMQKLKEKRPNLCIPQFMKFQDLLQIDEMSDLSTISSFASLSQNQTSELIEILHPDIQKTRLILLPRVKLTPNGLIYAGWTMEVASKVLKHYRDFEYQFLKCQIRNDFNGQIKNQPYLIQSYIRKIMNYLPILKECYVPLGWSQSQLRQGILWYTLQSQHIKTVNRSQILQFLGDFDEKKPNNRHLVNAALKAARIGQNFGSSWSFDASEFNLIYEDDIFADENKKRNFSDGIGCISYDLMEQFQQNFKTDDLAAIQIRYRGIKGLLSVNNELPQNTIKIRKSMVKYQCDHEKSVKYFDIIEFSKYKVGYLNRQIIVLLIANGITQQKIHELQGQYIDQLQNSKILEVMLDYIAFIDEEEYIFQREYDKKFESVGEVFKMILPKSRIYKQTQISKIISNLSFFRGLKVEARRKLLFHLKEKSRIRVQKSVRLFGVLDEFRVLNEYEVYCSIAKPQKNKKQNITGKSLITKNPCMHPADIRVVTCVSDEQIKRRLRQKGKDENLFEYLVNVIVLPQQGKYPLTMEISQSDLDGDEFFLCWDRRIVPENRLNPFIIDQKVNFVERQWTKSGFDQMLDFFVEYQNHHQLGRLSNSHLIFADMKGAHCEECIELCKLHSIAVQYPKRGYLFKIDNDLICKKYPHFMEKKHPLKSYMSSSILGHLYNDIILRTDLKKHVNDYRIFKQNDENFLKMTSQYIDLQKIKLQKYEEIEIMKNSIVRRYEQTNQTSVEKYDTMNFDDQSPQIVQLTERQQQIESDQFYRRKGMPFSLATLLKLQSFIDSNKQLKLLEDKQMFTLVQILTAFNYLCVYQYELQSLKSFLENHNESTYTIYFQLHTSNQNSNDTYILRRINEFREKWFRFFAEELVNDRAFERVQEFEAFYFNDLIEKKPQFQDTIKRLKQLESFKGLKKKRNKANFDEQIGLIIGENGQCDPQFIKDEILNQTIIKKAINYSVYRYSSIEEVNPMIYRKMLLYYMVSTHFKKLTEMQSYDKILTKFSAYMRPNNQSTGNGIWKKVQKFQEFKEAKKFYENNQVDLIGFCWFCIPKLMIIWWKDIIKKQEKLLDIQKKEEEQKKEVQRIVSNEDLSSDEVA